MRYLRLCQRYKVEPGQMEPFIDGLLDCRKQLQAIYQHREQGTGEVWEQLVRVLDEVSPGWCDNMIGHSAMRMAMKEVGRLAILNAREDSE